MISVRMLVWSFLVCLLTGPVDTIRGITLKEFCGCWNASVSRTGNVLLVHISFVKNCWESPSQDYDGFPIIHYDSAMLFKIGIRESFKEMLKVEKLQCQINKEDCSTHIKMVRDTSLEIVPFCKFCDSCMGKKTDYITYQNSSKIKGKIKINIMDSTDKESYKPKLLVLGGVVTALIIIIIFALACFIDKHRRKKREEMSLLTPDDFTDVSIQLPIGRPEVSPNLIINSPQIHTPPVKVGVFYPHLPKELFSESIENPLDKCVQRMMDILTSVSELDVKYLHYDFNNFFDEIDTVSSSPNIILVLCDRLCELSQEVATSDVNITAEQRREIETLLLKRIHQQYYLNSTNIFFVNFEHLKQQENVLGTARKMFTKHKVYSIGPLIETDQHFSKLLHSILSDVISNTEDRQERIKSILSPETI